MPTIALGLISPCIGIIGERNLYCILQTVMTAY